MSQLKLSPVVILLIVTVLAIAVACWEFLANRSAQAELSQAKKDIDSAATVIGNVHHDHFQPDFSGASQ